MRPYARNIIRAYEAIDMELPHISEGKEVLTVVTTYGVLEFLDAKFIQQFYEKNPNVILNLVEMTDYPAMQKLEKQEAELAVIPAPIDSTRFRGYPLMTSRHCLLINKKNPLSQKELIEYVDLKNQPLVLKGRSYAMYNSNINRFLAAGVEPEIYLETSDEKLMLELVRQNIAIGVSLEHYWEKYQESGIACCWFSDPSCCRTVYAAHLLNAKLSPIAQSFLEHLIEYFERWKKEK